MLNNLTIKARLILVVGLMSLLAISMGILGLDGMKKANEGLLTVYVDRTIPMGQLGEIKAKLLSNRLAITNTLVFKEENQKNIELSFEAGTPVLVEPTLKYHPGMFEVLT